LVLRTALLFVRSAVRLVYAELPGPGSGVNRFDDGGSTLDLAAVISCRAVRDIEVIDAELAGRGGLALSVAGHVIRTGECGVGDLLRGSTTE
jgi:hypothetical protein